VHPCGTAEESAQADRQARDEGSGPGHKIGHTSVPAAPLFELAPDQVAGAASPATTSIGTDVARSLADALARALTAGDHRTARRILAALSALTADDATEAAPER